MDPLQKLGKYVNWKKKTDKKQKKKLETSK